MNPRQLARFGALAALTGMGEAAAEERQRNISAGVYASWVFGGEHGWSWGVVASDFVLLQGWSSCINLYGVPTGVGPLVRVGLRDLGSPRLVIAAAGGVDPLYEVRAIESVHAEAGVTIPLAEAGRTGLHGALTVGSLLANVSAQSDPGMGELLSAGVGLQYPGFLHDTSICAISGRPVRDAEGRRLEGRARPGAGALARAWAEDARMEAGSVASFLGLADELSGLGAPDELVDAALDAAEDEVLHAAMAAARHATVSSSPLEVQVPAPPLRDTADRERALCRLALESLVDALIGEGAAADEAEAAAAHTSDPAIAAHYARIAQDERRHAALGGAVLRWAIDEGGEPVRNTLRGALAREFDVALPGEDLPDRLPGAQVVELRRARLATERERVAGLLG